MYIKKEYFAEIILIINMFSVLYFFLIFFILKYLSIPVDLGTKLSSPTLIRKAKS